MAHLCVALVPIFAPLDQQAQAQVATYARPRHLERGESLYLQGESVSQLFVVHKGVVKLTHTRLDGSERIVRTVAPGEVVGEAPFLTGARPDHSATALEPMTACTFDHRSLGRLIDEHPMIASQMLRELSIRLAESEQRVAMLASPDVAARIAEYVLTLPSHRTESGIVVTLPMSKREVAAYLGTTPESLSRALTRLKRQGAISVSGRDVALLDIDRLSALAGD